MLEFSNSADDSAMKIPFTASTVKTEGISYAVFAVLNHLVSAQAVQHTVGDELLVQSG